MYKKIKTAVRCGRSPCGPLRPTNFLLIKSQENFENLCFKLPTAYCLFSLKFVHIKFMYEESNDCANP
jgi:hypothetical protein